jgi:hypothetical protein
MAETGRCASCRWWVPEDGDDPWGDCRLATMSDTEQLSMGRGGWIRFYIGSEPPAPLGTAPDFGCVQHEPREAGGEACPDA